MFLSNLRVRSVRDERTDCHDVFAYALNALMLLDLSAAQCDVDSNAMSITLAGGVALNFNSENLFLFGVREINGADG
jgi:hypothetical protein